MKIIKFYSPVDGEIKKSSSNFFSKKDSSNQIIIETYDKSFYSPLENGIFEKTLDNDAFLIKDDKTKLSLLIKIILNQTVNKDNLININIQPNEIVDLDARIANIDLDLSSDPIKLLLSFDSKEYKNFKFIKNFKVGKIKKGELIGTFEQRLDSNNKVNNLEYESEFSKVAKHIYENIGTVSNYTSLYSCMTRLKIKIKNKDLINEKKLIKNHNIKNIKWNGSELQIIIEGSSNIVKQEIKNIVKQSIINNKKAIEQKVSFKNKFLNALEGIILPVVPVFMAAGILMSIRVILLQYGTISDINNLDMLRESDILSATMFILPQLGIGFLGIFFCINTVKYLNGNVVMGAFVGLALASPYLMWGVKFTLFSIGNLSFEFGGYYNSILPQVLGGAIYFYSDRWIKTWMPSFLDLVLRHAMAFTTAAIAIFFVFGPFLTAVETGISIFLNWLGAIKYGFGTAMFAMLWEPLVLTGMHVAVFTTIIVNLPSPLYGVTQFSIIAQLGAAVAIGIMTRNRKVKKEVVTGIPGGLFGIVEPVLYKINIPRFWPFIYGCLAAFIGGLIAGNFGFDSYVPGGSGLLAITRFIPGGIYMINLFLICLIISFALGVALTLTFYKERMTEKQSLNNLNKKFIKFASKYYNNEFSIEVINQLKGYSKELEAFFSNENQKEIKLFERNFIKIEKQNKLLNYLIYKDTSKKEKVFIKYERVRKKQNQSLIQKYYDKFQLLTDNPKILTIKENIKIMQKEGKVLKNNFELLQKDVYIICDKILEEIKSNKSIKHLSKIDNNYFNAINTLDISLNMVENKREVFKFKKPK